MKKALAVLATVTSVTTLLGATHPAFADAGSGTASDAATQAAACAVASDPNGGVTGTAQGSGGTSAGTSSTTGTSSSALTASSTTGSSADNPSTLNCPECPPTAAAAIQQILQSSDPFQTSSASGSPVCDPTLDAFCISTNDPDEGSGNPLAPVTRLLPSQGIIAIGTKNPTTPDGTSASGLPIYPFYIFYDGYPSTISPLGGYIGINGYDVDYALLGLVASTDPNDNFNRLGGNVPLIGNLIASLQLMTDQEKWSQTTQDVNQLLPGLNSQGVGTSPICDPNDLLCLSTHDPLEGTGNPLAPITRLLPTQGILALGPYNPDTGTTLIFTPQGIDLSGLYLFYDGEPYSIDPLGGYVGLNGHDFDTALLGLVASLKNTDNFNRAGGNLPIIGYPTAPFTTAVSPLLVRISNP